MVKKKPTYNKKSIKIEITDGHRLSIVVNGKALFKKSLRSNVLKDSYSYRLPGGDEAEVSLHFYESDTFMVQSVTLEIFRDSEIIYEVFCIVNPMPMTFKLGRLEVN